jgi:beta-lactamase class A
MLLHTSYPRRVSAPIFFACGGLFLLVGLGFGYYFGKGQQITYVQKRANDPSLIYTNPLLSCGISEKNEFSEYKPLERAINTVVANYSYDNENVVSVYYRDLVTGRWFGINEKNAYPPASLLKVPLMIAYFKEAEDDPTLLNKKIFYAGDGEALNAEEYYRSKSEIQANQYYTVDELITSMIEHSDNIATVLLFKNIDNNSLREIMSNMGLTLPPVNDPNSATDDFMTVKSYSYLFRLLYNSTFLNRTMSEKALKLLASTDFKDGLDGGLPTDVKAAQKFGERTVTDVASGQATERNLHDCGIVYKTDHPYLLCVMTKGKDFSVLSTIIKNISKTVYEKTRE